MNKIKYLDSEEKKLMKSLGKGEWVSNFSQSIKREYEEYAKDSLYKQKRIHIEMSEKDLRKIQTKALQEGLPYQSLISMLIHKFNEGLIVFSRKRNI